MDRDMNTMTAEERKVAAKYAASMLDSCATDSLTSDIFKSAGLLLSLEEVLEIAAPLQIEGTWWMADADDALEKICDKISIRYMHRSDRTSDQLHETRMVVDKVSAALKAKSDANFMLPKIKQLKNIFKLSSLECEIISFLYFEHEYSFIHRGTCDFERFIGCLEKAYAALFDVSPRDIVKIMRPSAPLRKNNLVCGNKISHVVADFIVSDEKSFIGYLCRKGSAPFYDINSFPIEKKDCELAADVIKNVPDAHLLIYGPPGTGKTEFAKSLALSCGRTPYFVNECQNVYLAVASSKGGSEIIIADEADNIFNEMGAFSQTELKKGKVNQKLDGLNKQCIFICNYIDGIDPSVLRRFTLSIPFRKLSEKEQAEVWKRNVADLNKFADEESIVKYSKKYTLPVGIVANSASAAVKCGRSESKMAEYFEAIMDSHANIIKASKNKRGKKENDENREKKKVSEMFNIDYLNTNIDILPVIAHVKKYAELEKTRKDLRCSLLFYGVPGTGKTEFARYIAALIGKESIVLKGSDIKDMYIGQSEKHIRDAFRKAQEESAMLIFDEVDSMLYDRAGAHRSWERSEVNEFLAQMDEYRGMLACTTNFLESLDSACLRRFDWKVGFKPLESEQLLKALNSYFCGMGFIDDEIKSSWIGKLTLGDIAVVANRAKLMETDKLGITASLDAEVACKQKTNGKNIGF